LPVAALPGEFVPTVAAVYQLCCALSRLRFADRRFSAVTLSMPAAHVPAATAMSTTVEATAVSTTVEATAVSTTVEVTTAVSATVEATAVFTVEAATVEATAMSAVKTVSE